MLGALFRTIGPFARRPRPAPSPRRSGAARSTCAGCSAGASTGTTLERDVLEITAFKEARDFGEHFKARYGPAIAARANAEKDGREDEFDSRDRRVLRRVGPR